MRQTSEHLATEKVKVFGKQAVNFSLAEMEQEWRAFWQTNGVSKMSYPLRVHQAWVGLLEKMSYRAHFFELDPVTGQWMLENVTGVNSWMVADPRDYFIFAG